MKNHCNTVRSC